MSKNRIALIICALIGAVLGAGLGFMLAPNSHRYEVSAKVGLLPAANLTTEKASAFWEVLTRGQVTRTAAVVYRDNRWLPAAAQAAKVHSSELSLTAKALPETTFVEVTVEAGSAAAAESALTDVLTTATPEVTSVVIPYTMKILWPPPRSARVVPAPSSFQVASAGAIGGLFLGAGIGWFVGSRWRRDDVVGVPADGVGEMLPARP